jgi:hypothetical protein
MSRSLFDVSDNNRSTLHSTTNANESYNNQIKNERQITRQKLSTTIEKLYELQRQQAAQLTGAHAGARFQYRRPNSTPRSSQRPPQSQEEAHEQRKMKKQFETRTKDKKRSDLRVHYVAFDTDGAPIALVAALAFNELSQPGDGGTNNNGDDDNNNQPAIARLVRALSTNKVLTSASVIVDQLRNAVATKQRRDALLGAIASMRPTPPQSELQELVSSFVVNNGRYPIDDAARLFAKEQLIFTSAGNTLTAKFTVD